MSTFDVVLVFDVGDPETVAKIRFERVNASHPAEAILIAGGRAMTTDGSGFEMSDLIEATATNNAHGVKRNLLAHYTS